MAEQGLPFAGYVEPNGDDGVTAVDLRQTDRPVAFRIDGKGIEPIMRDEVEGRQRLPAPAFTVPKEIAYPVSRIARSAGIRQSTHDPNLALAIGDIFDSIAPRLFRNFYEVSGQVHQIDAHPFFILLQEKIGSASCRERGCQ